MEELPRGRLPEVGARSRLPCQPNAKGLGFGVSSFSGKLGGLRKIISGVDATSPEIDLTGTVVKITGSKSF